MRLQVVAATVALVSSLVSVQAQTPPVSQPPAPASQTPAPQRRPRPVSTRIVVRDFSGTPIQGVKVAIAGQGARELTTDASGAATVTLADGTYRLRFQHDRFITLEKEVTAANGRPAEIAVVLNIAPPPPEPPPPPPAPETPPPPPPAPHAEPASPTNVSVPAFLDKNFIGRDPLKESILACTPDATIRLLQLREPMAAHTHSDVDEFLYVVAGEGAVRIGDESTVVSPGTLTVIPRETQHAIERRGRNPLIVLSTLSGTPCATGVTTLYERKPK